MNCSKILYKFIYLLMIVNIAYSNSSVDNKQLEKISLQLQWLDQFQFAGYYIAKEKGFYKDVGLDVEIKKFNYDIVPVNEVVNKNATYGMGRSSLIINKSDGANIKILASIFQSSPIVLLATKESGIKTINDFIGKRVMTTKDTATTVSPRAMVNKKGVYKKDIIKLEHSFNIDDLINNKTDLMVSYISNEPYQLDKKGIEYTIFDPKDYGFDFYSDILFTSDDELFYHKDRANNFTQASIQGWEYAFENIEETVELILKKYNSQNKTKEALIYEANKLKELAYYKNSELGHIELNKMQRIYDIYNVMGFVNHKIDFDKFVVYSHKYKNNIDYVLILQIVVVVFILFLVVLYRQRLLKKSNIKLAKAIKKATLKLKRRNKKLKESLDGFEYLIDTAIESIAIFDENKNLVQMNKAGIEMFKFDNLKDAIGTNIENFIPQYESQKIATALKLEKLNQYEIDLKRKDGTIFPSLVAGRNIVRNNKKYRLTTVIDLSEIKQKDMMIEQQSKLALMGEMISMIAHQWRQPLNIIGAINMKVETKLDFQDTITAKDYAPISEDINTQLEFMSKTIDDFRSFFKTNKEKTNTTYEELINASLSIIGASIKSKHIELINEINCKCTIDVYFSEVTQVVLNIIKNAEDILLEKKINNPYIKLVTYQEGEKCILEIIDNGGGIPESIIDKIFDPYFSTKLEKHGTGLGLYMSQTIIEEHCGGKLSVCNKGDEVIFKIVL